MQKNVVVKNILKKYGEVKHWIEEENARLKKEYGYEFYYYWMEGCIVRYMDYDRAPSSWTFLSFWDEKVRPRTPEEIEEKRKRQEEFKKWEEEYWREQELKKAQKKKEEEIDFKNMTGVDEKDAVYYEELPNDGQMYYKTEKGYTLIKG